MTEKPKKNADLPVRLVSAVVMLAVAGAALWLGGWWWTIFCCLIGIGIFVEWVRLVLKMTSSAARQVVGVILGLAYIGLAILLLGSFGNNQLMGAPVGVLPWLLISIVAVVIATDTGAYFSGRAIGGPKIAPSISPSKTWAGLLGGMLLASAVLAFLASHNLTGYGVIASAAIGAILAVVAQAGDFLESWMKRKAGVKDSSNLIPGHGGLFDRLDGLLSVSWVVALSAIVMLSQAIDL